MYKFAVQQDKFDGPLGLLLTLITEHKMHVSEVSLAKIADTYIDYIGKLDDFPIPETADFLVVASTLMLIKSRALLPGITITEDEQSEIKSLEERLRLYVIHKEASKLIETQFGSKAMLMPARRDDPVVYAPPEADKVSPALLYACISNMIETMPYKISIPQTAIKKIESLEEVMNRLMSRVAQGVGLSFNKVRGKNATGTAEQRIGIVITFLAILELIRRGKIAATQSSIFHDIIIEPEIINTPVYA